MDRGKKNNKEILGHHVAIGITETYENHWKSKGTSTPPLPQIATLPPPKEIAGLSNLSSLWKPLLSIQK